MYLWWEERKRKLERVKFKIAAAKPNRCMRWNFFGHVLFYDGMQKSKGCLSDQVVLFKTEDLLKALVLEFGQTNFGFSINLVIWGSCSACPNVQGMITTHD